MSDLSKANYLYVFVAAFVICALSLVLPLDHAYATSADNPNPGTHLLVTKNADGSYLNTYVANSGETVSRKALGYEDSQTGIAYYGLPNSIQDDSGNTVEDGTATLTIIVLDGMIEGQEYVTIPSVLSDGTKNYQVTALSYDHRFGTINDWKNTALTDEARDGSNQNIFGEEIKYATSSQALSSGDTEYPSERLASIKSIVVPDSVKTISGYTFAGCTGVQEFTFSKNSALETIAGADAFRYCESLETIELPSSLKEIGTKSTFYYCTALKSIVLPASLKSLPASCFTGCSALSSVELSENAKFNELSALYVFQNCSSLTHLDLTRTQELVVGLASQNAMGRSPFFGSSIEIVNLPNGVTIQYNAFANSALLELVIPDDAVINKSVSRLAMNCKQLRTIEVPSTGLTTNMFAQNDSALELVCVNMTSNGELSLGLNTFNGCTSLNTIEINGDVRSFSVESSNGQYSSFNNCKALHSLVFNGNVSAPFEASVAEALESVKSTVVIYGNDAEWSDEAGANNGVLPTWCHDNGFIYKSLAPMGDVKVELTKQSYVYTGGPIEAEVTVKDGETPLVKDVDFSVMYLHNTNYGAAKAIVTGLGKYSALTETLTFNIVADKSALDEAIANAEAAQAEAVASADGSDVAKDAKWVPEDVATALDDALAAAKEASEDDAATQAAVDEARTALAEAVEAFRSAEKPGTMVDKTALNEAIEAASAIEQGKKTDEAKAALDTAIAAAQAVAADASATDEDVADAVSALEAAVKAFNESADAVEPEPEPEPQPSPEPEPIVPATADTRLAGDTALDTMSAIVKAGFPSSDAVVVASLDGYWDALAASSLAGQAGCPVLMTDPSSLSGQTAAEIARLGAKKAYIAGGTMAVSDNVESQLKAKGLSVERLWGADAQVTAVKIAGALGSDHASTCVIATSGGYWDALSASPYAYVAKAPVFLTDSDGVLRADTLAAIKAGGYTSAVIAGGTAAVDKSAEAALKGAGVSDVVRCGGKDAYETAVLLAKWEMAQGMGVSHIGVATSANGYWDALSGAALCGVNNSVIVLADEGATSAIDALVAPNAAGIEAVNVFGGTMAIGPGVDTAIAKALAGNAKLAAQSSAQLVAASLAA